MFRTALFVLIFGGGFFLYTQKAEAICPPEGEICGIIYINISASPDPVDSGQSTTITWSISDNTTWCSEDGPGFTMGPGTSGSDQSSPLTSNETFSITCGNDDPARDKTVSVTVGVASAAPPTVSLYADPTTVDSGDQTRLSWDSTNATSCTGSGPGFSTGGSPDGNDWSSALTANTDFDITCTGPGGQASDGVSVSVNTAPTTYELCISRDGDGIQYAEVSASNGLGDSVECGGSCTWACADFEAGSTATFNVEVPPPHDYFEVFANDSNCSLTEVMNGDLTCSGTFYAPCSTRNIHNEIGNSPMGGSVLVWNNAPNCDYDISLASYYVFDPVGSPNYIDSQILYDSDYQTVPADGTRNFSVSVPGCANQIDLIDGIAPPSSPDLGAAALDWAIDAYPLCGASCTALPDSVDVGETVSLDADGGTGTDWEWDMDGSGASCSGPSCSDTFDIVGDFNISVRSDSYEPWSDACPVSVNPIGGISVDLKARMAGVGSYVNGPVTLPESGGSIDLQWETTGDPTSCTASASPSVTGWSGSKSTAGGTDTGVVNGATARIYEITCSNAINSDTDTVSVTISSSAEPVCSPDIQNVGLNTNATVSATEGTGMYSWTGGETPPGGNGPSFTTKYSTTGAKTVIVTSGVETDTCTINVVSEPPPPGTLTCEPLTQNIAPGGTADFSASGGTEPYTWSAPGGSPSSGVGGIFSAIFNTVGTYYVTVTGQSSPTGTNR